MCMMKGKAGKAAPQAWSTSVSTAFMSLAQAVVVGSS